MTNITPEDDKNANSGDKPFAVFRPGQPAKPEEHPPVDAADHVNANGVDHDASANGAAAADTWEGTPDQAAASAQAAPSGQEPAQYTPPAQEPPQTAPSTRESAQYAPPAEEQFAAAPASHEPAEPLEPLAPAGSADAPVPLIEPEEPAAFQPAQEQPTYEQPAYEQPAYEQPAYEQPAYEQPAYEQPAYDQGSADPATQAYSSAPPADATVQQPAYEPTQVYPQQQADPTYPPQTGYPVASGYAQQPTYVQAPIPPKKKSNRLAGTLITLLGTLIFAILYTAAAAIIVLIGQPVENLTGQLTDFLMSWVFWAPVAGFTIVLVLIVLIVNNANWWAYVLGGFLVGIATYFATIGGAMLAAQSWTMTADAGVQFLADVASNPLTIASGLIAREVTIWMGGWIAARGRRVKARNAEAQAEFERLQSEQPGYSMQPTDHQHAGGYPQA